MNVHVTSSSYLWTLVALLALAGASFALSYVALGRYEITVAMVIAVAKTALVALFFMHLIEQRPANALALFSAVAFVAILLSLMVLDVVTRTPGLYEQGR
jgi:cytochrome c oxidase subunit 4